MKPMEDNGDKVPDWIRQSCTAARNRQEIVECWRIQSGTINKDMLSLEHGAGIHEPIEMPERTKAN
jgi:hypothetical protein